MDTVGSFTSWRGCGGPFSESSSLAIHLGTVGQQDLQAAGACLQEPVGRRARRKGPRCRRAADARPDPLAIAARPREPAAAQGHQAGARRRFGRTYVGSRSDLRFLIGPWILFGRYSRRLLLGRTQRCPRRYPAGPSPRSDRLAHKPPQSAKTCAALAYRAVSIGSNVNPMRGSAQR